MATPLLQLELCVSAVLLILAVVWNAWRGLDLWQALQWSGRYGIWGLVAAVPPLLLIPLLELSWSASLPFLRHFRRDVHTRLLPLLTPIRFTEALMLAGLAGLSEEVFFRGVLQPEIGLVWASLAFGLLHALSVAYVLWATVVGAYLGYLAQWSGNLWLPIVAHSVIDLIGLCYIRYIVAARLDRGAEQGADRDRP
jgi:membrane protease YdiL (CAAX protease family)